MKAVAQKEQQQPSTTVESPEYERDFITPVVDIYESKDGYVVEAEMPGVSKEGLEITLEGNELTITGHRKLPELEGETLFRESSGFDYRRMFELDPAIDTGKISAKMEQGFLTLTLPKSERVKPRKIAVS